jgi:serine/threonine protein kinase
MSEATEQDGGDQIDSGSYGCIFRPALRCKPKTKQDLVTSAEKDKRIGRISKITTIESADSEFKVSTVLHSIPLWKNYFVLTESVCEPAEKQTDKDLSSCRAIQGKSMKELRLITMPYMGTTMSTYRFPMDRFDTMRFIQHLVEAGALLALFGVTHRDLHQGNIVIDDQMVPRVIDYNLAFPIDARVFPELLRDFLAHTYDPTISQEPPDSVLVNAVSMGQQAHTVIRDTVRRKQILRRITTLLGVSPREMEESLHTFYYTSKAARSGDTAQWFRVYYRTIDSWAIGVLIVDLLIKISMWPAFTAFFQQHKEVLLPLLKKMCAVNPMERFDCVQALSVLDPSNFILRKYGRTWLAKYPPTL